MLTLANTPISRLYLLYDWDHSDLESKKEPLAAIWTREGVELHTTYNTDSDIWETSLETQKPYFMMRSAQDYGAELGLNKYNDSFPNPLGEVFPLTPSVTKSERNPMLRELLKYLAEKEDSDLSDPA